MCKGVRQFTFFEKSTKKVTYSVDFSKKVNHKKIKI